MEIHIDALYYYDMYKYDLLWGPAMMLTML